MSAVSTMIEQTSIKYDRLAKKLSRPLFDHFGITYFCYQWVSNDGHWFTLGNNPDWLLYSGEHQFYQFDPSLIKPHHYQSSSICFPQHHKHDDFQQIMIAKAIHVFDLDHALAIIEPNSLGCEYFFFSAPQKHRKVLDIYLAQLTTLRRDYLHHVKKEVKPVYEHCLAHSVNLNQINPVGFNSQNIMTVELIDQQDMAFISAINNTPPLTLREQDCLKLYRQGLTAKQTAQQMKLSHRTIEDYFENIKEKLGVTSKRELL